MYAPYTPPKPEATANIQTPGVSPLGQATGAQLHSERLMQLTDTTVAQSGNGGQERKLYIHEDPLGTTKKFTKGDGTEFDYLKYDAWGLPVQPNKLVNNDHGNYIAANFTGHTFDTTLGMYHAEARFYDAGDRTFVARDSAFDGINWYKYCNNNPASYWDPTGMAVSYFQQVSGSGAGSINYIPNPKDLNDIMRNSWFLLTYLTSRTVDFYKLWFSYGKYLINIDEITNGLTASSMKMIFPSISQALRATPFIGVGVDTGMGIYYDIKAGEEPERITANAIAVALVGGGSIEIGTFAEARIAAPLRAGALGARAGSRAGLIGAIAGTAAGIIAYNVLTNSGVLNGKSPEEALSDVIYSRIKSLEE